MSKAVKTYTYMAMLEPGTRRGYVVTFPDVPEAVTQGRDTADAKAMASESLGLALLSYPARGAALPMALKRNGENLLPVTVAPDIAAKLAVMEAFVAAKISKSELARRIGKDEKEVRRILDPRHQTKLPAIETALRALGKRLVVGVTDFDRA